MGVIRALFGLIAKPSSWPVIALLIAVIGIVGVTLHVNSLKAQRDRLRDQTAALEETVKQREATISQLARDKATYEGRVKAVMDERAKLDGRIVENAEAAQADYRAIMAPSGDVRVLERQANEGYAKLFRDLNALSR